MRTSIQLLILAIVLPLISPHRSEARKRSVACSEDNDRGVFAPRK